MIGKQCYGVCMLLLAWASLFPATWAESYTYSLEVLPAEHQRKADPETGAALLFLTSDPGKDINLYYHQRSWLTDNTVIFFESERVQGGVMGYWVETGALVKILGPDGAPIKGATASVYRNSLFGVWDGKVVELNLDVQQQDGTTQATASLREIAAVKPSERAYVQLNENCDSTLLAYSTMGHGIDGGPQIFLVDIEMGTQKELVSLPPHRGSANHVQWSRTSPQLMSFSSLMEPHKFRAGPYAPSRGNTDYEARCQRLWVIDINEGIPRNVYEAVENELVTHAVWWINDSILFTGAMMVEAPDWSHVKVIEVESGAVRVIGAGAWWPGATPEAMARRNWWHPSGSDDGHWIVADNWHGDIMLFEGRTTRPWLLTKDHRTYGSGDHPHPGWDRRGDQVIFTSHQLGSADVCVATIPAPWQEHVARNTDGIGNPALRHKIVPQGKVLFEEYFTSLDNWHLEGHTAGVSLLAKGGLRLDCTGSQQGGVGVHAFLKQDLPDNICLEYDLYAEEKNGLMLNFIGMQGVNGEDAITGVPAREGRFIDYTGAEATTRSYHLSLSRYNDKGIHTGVSNWRRNPGLNLVGQGADPCEEIKTTYHVAVIKQGPHCQLQVDGKVISGFLDDAKDPALIPGAGKIGFRAIGAKAIVQISNLKVTALE